MSFCVVHIMLRYAYHCEYHCMICACISYWELRTETDNSELKLREYRISWNLQVQSGKPRFPRDKSVLKIESRQRLIFWKEHSLGNGLHQLKPDYQSLSILWFHVDITCKLMYYTWNRSDFDASPIFCLCSISCTQIVLIYFALIDRQGQRFDMKCEMFSER